MLLFKQYILVESREVFFKIVMKVEGGSSRRDLAKFAGQRAAIENILEPCYNILGTAKRYSLNVANSTFFSSKQGDFVPFFIMKKSSVGVVVPHFFGSPDGKFYPKSQPCILYWVLIKGFPMISRVPKGFVRYMVI